MSKRSLSVGILTAGLTVGLAAAAIGPAAAQGNPVGGAGNVYFLSGALNHNGQAQQVYAFGNNDDEVYYGDWYNQGVDQPMVRRGNVFFVPKQSDNFATDHVFVYGDPGDKVLVGDWNGDGTDSVSIRRGNQFLVKNDNLKSGKADSEFFYGDQGDTVLVGNWNGVSSPASNGTDNSVPPDNDTDDAGSPATAADIKPVNDLGFNAVPADNSYNEPGDRRPGTGVDNNGDGDYDDLAKPAVTADVPAGPAKGDTLMIQRGNQFFVKNSITSGKADYTFFFGDPGDTLLVGNWATPAKAETGTSSRADAQSAVGGDQLAVRRGFTYYQSSELEDARTKKTNPSTARVFAFGNPDDTVFVASLGSPQVDEFGRPVPGAAVPVNYAAGNPMWTAGSNNVPVQKQAAAADTTTDKVDNTGAYVDVDGTPGNDKYAVGDPMFVFGTGAKIQKLAGAGDINTQKVNQDGTLATVPGAPATITGDGLGVRR